MSVPLLYKTYDDIPSNAEFHRVMDAHCEALMKASRDPGSLTDDDIQYIEIMSPDSAHKARAARERVKAPPKPSPAAVAPQRPAVKTARWRKGESISEFFDRCKAHATPVYVVKHMFAALSNAHKQHNARFDALEQQAAATHAELREEIKSLRAELEQRPGMTYRGVWQNGTAYNNGDVVTDRGSMWVARGTTVGRPGEDHPVWTLAVKKGRDGRDGRV